MRTGLAGLTGAIAPALHWAIVPAVAIGLLPVASVMLGGPGTAAVMAALADPLTVLAARSPGARPVGALTQTKNRKAPEEQVSAKALTRPLEEVQPGLGPVAPEDPPAGDVVAPAPGNPVQAADIAPAPSVVTPTSVGYFPVGGIVIAPGTSLTPGTGTSPTPPAVTPVTPVVSVPEPATWISLMIGFGAVGGAMRVRRTRRAGAAGSAQA